MSAALTSRASLPQMWEASSRTIRKLRTQYITAWRLFMSAALISRASLPQMWEALSRTIPKLRPALVSEARSPGYRKLLGSF